MRVKVFKKQIIGCLTRSIPNGADGITLDGRPLYIEDAPTKKVKILKVKA